MKICSVPGLIILILLVNQQPYFTTASDEIPHAKAGVILSFKQDFIDEYRESYTEKYLDYLKKMTFPPIKTQFEVSVLNVNGTFFNININQSTFNANKSVISMHEKSPCFEIRLVEVGINVNFNYTMISDPDLVNDTGYGNLLIQDLNLTLLTTPFEEKEFFNFNFSEIEIQIDDFELMLYGGDLSSPIDNYLNIFKEYVKSHLVGVVEQDTTRLIQDYINGYLNDMRREHIFKKLGLEIDYNFMKNGVIVKDRYTSVLLDGTMHLESNKNITKNFSNMPIHNPDREDIQLFVSEYTLNNLLHTVSDLEMFKYNIENQTSDNVDAIITQFEDSFGDHKNISIYICGAKNSYSTHLIKVTPKSTIFEFGIEIHIRNPYDPTQDVALILSKMTANIVFSIDGDLLLSGDVDQLNLDVIDFKPYYVTKTQAKDINTRLAILSPLLNSYINKALDDGYRIPIPLDFAKYIKKEKVTTHDGYLLIDGDVDFKSFEDNLPDIDNNNSINNENQVNQTDSTDPISDIPKDSNAENQDSQNELNENSQIQESFRVAKQLRRNLQDNNHKFRKHDQPLSSQSSTQTAGSGKAHFTPTEKKEAQDRFYLLVEQVYQSNMKNYNTTDDANSLGQSQQTQTSNILQVSTYQDEIIQQVQDLLKGNLTDNLTKNWTDEMKANSKIVQEDYKSGKLQFKDIDLARIEGIAWTSIENAMSTAVGEIKSLGDSIEGELKHDLGVLENAGKKIGGFFGGLFGGN